MSEALRLSGSRAAATSTRQPIAILQSVLPRVPAFGFSHTHFELKETSPNQALSDIQNTLSQCEDYDFEVSNYSVKGVKYLNNTQVNFLAHIFSTDSLDGEKLVLELNRENGCAAAFNEIFQDLKRKLSSSVEVVSGTMCAPCLDMSDHEPSTDSQVSFVSSVLSSLLTMTQEPKMAIQSFQSLNALFSSQSTTTIRAVVSHCPQSIADFAAAFTNGLTSQFIEIRSWSLAALATIIRKVDDQGSLFDLLAVSSLLNLITETAAPSLTLIPDSTVLALKEFNRQYIAVILALNSINVAIPNKSVVESKLHEYQQSIGQSSRSRVVITELSRYNHAVLN